ncbi:acyltransferase-like protein [Tepidibacillus fermentans]|uniref:Acyltransferase-like protein n=1 Tax=Tepidibacillus fermentans TaxID=1281767 RepID=A0A4R3KC65_9BACI|nr:acyltransferase-like protein [Tepidibacillus fermentans]
MFYSIVKALLWAILKLYNRITVHGLSFVPRKGAFILVANHSSYLDPIYIGISIPRKLHFILKPAEDSLFYKKSSYSKG